MSSINNLNKITKTGKYKWSINDNQLCILGYCSGYSYIYVHRKWLSHIKISSIKMKYANCLYLKDGNVKGSLKNCSKIHCKLWKSINVIT